VQPVQSYFQTNDSLELNRSILEVSFCKKGGTSKLFTSVYINKTHFMG